MGEHDKRQNPIPNSNPEQKKREALLLRESQRTVMLARERSARGHMGLPSLAQRGEGRAGGWEWGVSGYGPKQTAGADIA